MADHALLGNENPQSKPPQQWTALVTGGASGIGEATARKLASRSINVLVADVNDAAGEKLADALKEEYAVDACYQHVDVSKEDDVKKMVEAVVERWGRLDYAANVAGICIDIPYVQDEANCPMDVVQKTWEINQKGVWLCQKFEAEQMKKQEPRAVTFSPPSPMGLAGQRGSIVNVASTASLTAYGCPAYTPTKHAVIGITKNGAYYYGKYGIRCNSISPHGTVTPLMMANFPEGTEVDASSTKMAENVPLRKYAWPQEQANVISFLLSSESSNVCGTNIEVDGGFTNARVAM